MTVSEKIDELKIQQAALWIKAQAESGLTKEAWCDQNGIKRWMFYKYQRKLRSRMLDAIEENTTQAPTVIVNQPSFVEIPSAEKSIPADTLPLISDNNYNCYNDYKDDNFDNCDNCNNSDKSDNNYKDTFNNASSIEAATVRNPAEVTISYGAFTISINGAADEALLTSVLRAARNA